MSKPAISVENLSKAYRIGVKDEIPDTLVGALSSIAKSPFKNFNRLRRLDTFNDHKNGETDSDDTLWALKDVSFDVQEGEVVGIIGRNGAGKSTLLKVLSRITEPTSGRVKIRGRVSSLLEVGTGFHPELTGRENIYMNGTILGMTKREIDRKFDEIVDFSGVERFLDTPVKRYSSGMSVRLAFAVAAHLEPEILIIDEVLAVGDAEFQKKCLGKMKDVAEHGRTVLFVSHNMPSLQNLCEKGYLLEYGKLKFSGEIERTIGEYINTSRSYLKDNSGALKGCVTIDDACLLDPKGLKTQKVFAGSSFIFQVKYQFDNQNSLPKLAITFRNEFDQPVAWITTRTKKKYMDESYGNKGSITVTLDSFPLMPGHYSMDLYFGDQNRDYDIIKNNFQFEVVSNDILGTGKLPKIRDVGHVFLQCNWAISLY